MSKNVFTIALYPNQPNGLYFSVSFEGLVSFKKCKRISPFLGCRRNKTDPAALVEIFTKKCMLFMYE